MEQLVENQLKEGKKRIFPFDSNVYLGIVKARLSLDELFILDCPNVKELETEDLPKVKAYIQGLIRKGYLDLDRNLTDLGRKVLHLDTIGDIKKEKKKKIEAVKGDFDKWWEVYPVSNNFIHEGIHFPGIQSKRINKDKCAVIFNELSLKYKTEDIIEATRKHIDMAKDISLRGGQNQLNYISNSETYLRQEKFAPFLPSGQQKEKEQTLVNPNDLF